MNNITLESLIQEHKERIKTLKLNPKPPNGIGFKNTYSYKDSYAYQIWLTTTKRFIDTYYPNDKYANEFESVSNEKLSPEQQNKLIAILEAIDMLPTIVPNNKTPKSMCIVLCAITLISSKILINRTILLNKTYLSSINCSRFRS